MDGQRAEVSLGVQPTAAADPAVIAGVGAALERLLPALERYGDGHERALFEPYTSGTIGSDAPDLPDHGVGLDAMVDELAMAAEHGYRISAPGFVGFMTTGASTAGVAAQTALAQAGGQRYLLHALNALEWTGLRWLAQLCGIPAEAHGVFSSGGSTAQLLALGAARQAAFERLGFDVSADGWPAGHVGRVYVSERGHRTIHRAAAVLGLGRNGVREIPASTCGVIDVNALAEAMQQDRELGVIPPCGGGRGRWYGRHGGGRPDPGGRGCGTSAQLMGPRRWCVRPGREPVGLNPWAVRGVGRRGLFDRGSTRVVGDRCRRRCDVRA